MKQALFLRELWYNSVMMDGAARTFALEIVSQWHLPFSNLGCGFGDFFTGGALATPIGKLPIF